MNSLYLGAILGFVIFIMISTIEIKHKLNNIIDSLEIVNEYAN